MYKKVIEICNEKHSTRIKFQDLSDLLTSIMPKVREELEKVPQGLKDDLLKKHPAGKFRLQLTIEYARSKIQLPATIN